MTIMKINKIKLFANNLLFKIAIIATLAIASFPGYGIEKEGSGTKKFNFRSAPDANIENVDKALVTRHFLGDDVAVLSYLIRQTYVTRRTDTSSGTSFTETAKPAIYNSILNMNKQFKKAVKKGTYSREAAGKIYSDCLKKSYSLFYVETQELEKLMSEMETLEQYIALYNCISFE